jgi:Protein of unknown function (DUF3040)
MLSDTEHRRLAEIEALLRRDDPAFARRLDMRQPRRSRPRILVPLGLLTVVTVTVGGLALGGLVAAVVGLTVTAGLGAALAVLTGWAR